MISICGLPPSLGRCWLVMDHCKKNKPICKVMIDIFICLNMFLTSS